MYVHEMVQRELLQRSPMGRPDEIIQVDECLKKGKRKANCGRLMTGDTVPATLQNNHGGVADCGRWVFGLLWVSSDELRFFKVDQRDAKTPGKKRAQNATGHH